MKDAIQAKRSMLQNLRTEMAKADDGGLADMLKNKKMEKVTVASDSHEGLAKGLDKAKEILAKRHEMMGDKSDMEEGSAEEEATESPEEEAMEDEDTDEESPEQIKAKIAELQAKLAKK